MNSKRPLKNISCYIFTGIVEEAQYLRPSNWLEKAPVTSGDSFNGYFSYFFQQPPVPEHIFNSAHSVYVQNSNITISYAVFFNNLTVYGGRNSAIEIHIYNNCSDTNNLDRFEIHDIVPRTMPYPMFTGDPGSLIDDVYLRFINSSGTMFSTTELRRTLNINVLDNMHLSLVGNNNTTPGSPNVVLNVEGSINNICELPKHIT